MTVWMLVGVAVAAALTALVLRQTQAAYAVTLTVCVGVLMAVVLIRTAMPLFDLIERMFAASTVGTAYSAVLFKAFGIGLLSQTAADVCRDAGEGALAGKVEFGGKVLLLMCGLPLIEHAASLLDGLIRGQAVVP